MTEQEKNKLNNIDKNVAVISNDVGHILTKLSTLTSTLTNLNERTVTIAGRQIRHDDEIKDLQKWQEKVDDIIEDNANFKSKLKVQLSMIIPVATIVVSSLIDWIKKRI